MTSPRYSEWLPLRTALISSYRGRPDQLNFRYLPPGMTAWLVCRGRAEVVHGKTATTANAGQWLIPRPIARLQRFSDDIELLSVNFFAHWPTGEPLFDLSDAVILEARDHPKMEQRAMALDELIGSLVASHGYGVYMREMPVESYLQVQQVFMDFFRVLIEALATVGLTPAPPGSTDARLSLALNLIERHPYNQPIPLPQLAQAAGLSVVHLNRLAVQHLGKTLRQFCDRRRGEYARRCLLLPGIQVKQVALNLGFSTAGHFSRWFSKQYGLSPRQFQSQPRLV